MLLCAVIVGDVPNGLRRYMVRFTHEHVCIHMSTKVVDMPEDSLQAPQHPPTITHRPEGTWGNLKKGKEGTDEISTAKKITPEVLTNISSERITKHHVSPENHAAKSYLLMKSRIDVLPPNK